jgi:GT2 family glycosyltransferase
VKAAAVVPNWNGRRWLDGCLRALAAQERAFDEIVVVDGGSTDGSREALARDWPAVRVVALGRNLGFAAAANRGVAAVAGADAVALVNTDVELAPDWLARTLAALAAGHAVAAVATKMVSLRDRSVLDDCGDVLRRDGVCEQRGRGRADDGRWDAPGEVFSACAGAALYRRAALEAVGGFDERLFAYLEDVDLGLRLRLAGWRCRYEPAVARHWGGGSSGQLDRPVAAWVERNTLLVCARAFPWRWWLGPVAYRQLAWLVAAARGGRLRAFLGGAAAALPLLPAFLRERRALRARAVVAIEEAVPARPWRGPRAGGHPRAGF